MQKDGGIFKIKVKDWHVRDTPRSLPSVLDPHPELARAHFSPGDQIARWDSSWFLATLADQLCHGSCFAVAVTAHKTAHPASGENACSQRLTMDRPESTLPRGCDMPDPCSKHDIAPSVCLHRPARLMNKRPRRFHRLLVWHGLLFLMHAAHASGLETLTAEPPKAQRTQSVQLWNAAAVDRLYVDREGQPLWLEAGQPRPALASLIRVLDGLHTHGLNPDDYHLNALQEYINQPHGDSLPPEQQTQLERLATDAFLTLAIHMATGRVHPAVRKPRQIPLDALPQLTRLLVDAVAMDQVTAPLTPHPADPAIYSGLQAALIRWERASNLRPLPMGASLRPGDRNERIEALRDRLAAWEKLAAERPPAQAPVDDPQYFDEALTQRVADFQRQMGLDHDAVVGPQTITALNTSQAARLDQLRANLERQRWPAPTDSDRLIRVNLPDFTLSAIREGQEIWHTRVIVGRQYRPTPLLGGAIDTIVFNPTWEVPRRLVKEDLLPKIRADPGFLEREGMTLYQRTATGRIPVDPAILTQNASAEDPVADLGIRQAAGARNALGRIKFLFPNNEQVYLHDTPSKQLFERTRRMFSSGCIRVETPLTLARFLMETQPDWTQERMEQIIMDGKTRTVRIKPVPIQFVYWTAWPDTESGVLHFREDIYQSDQPLARALEQTPWN